MSALSVENVVKRYGRVEVLKGIDIVLEKGEFLVLLGPSGSGKSTLLNVIAGLDSATSGEIRIDGRLVNDVHPKDRDIAMVFQSYALYPNMTVSRNIGFGLEMRRMPKPEREEAVRRVARLLQLEPLLDRKPAQLSGGQRQRVAMGRALVRDPKIFLFDEPLSNLDAKLRGDMRQEIKRIHRQLGTTVVYVTHDQVEAMTLADRIAVMRDGAIQQCDRPRQVYDRPANMYVAGFIGSPPMNFIPAAVAAEGEAVGLALRSAEGAPFLPLSATPSSFLDWLGKPVVCGIRPEAIVRWDPALAAANPAWARLACAVTGLEPTGADMLTYIALGGQTVVARLSPQTAPEQGEVAELMVDTDRISLFDPESERRIEFR